MIAIKFIIALIALVPAIIAIIGIIRDLDSDSPEAVAGRKTNIRTSILSVALALGVIIFILPCFGQVPAGMRGVVLRFGAVTGEIKGEGLYAVAPFVNSIELMDVQVHAAKTSATAASRDLQNVATQVTVNFRLLPEKSAKVYQELRHDYVERILSPAVQEAVKSATAQFDAEKLIVERPTVKAHIEEFLQARLSTHGILVDGISITDFQFSKDFSDAIEAKVTATQQALKAENDLRRIKVEAEQRVAQAQAEAEAIRIQAQSISAQGGLAYVNLKAIEKWNGALPQWMTSGSTVPFVNLK